MEIRTLPSRFPRRQARRRRWVMLGATALVLLLALAALYPIADGWTTLPILQQQAALQALDDARQAGADRWAPEILDEAEGLRRLAVQAERREEAQILFLRDFRDTAALYGAAGARAHEAASSAQESRNEAQSEARAVIDGAARYLDAVERVAAQMPFPDIERIRLQQARTHSAEAEAFMALGEFEEAGEAARLAAVGAELAVNRAMPLAARFVAADEVRQWRQWVDETIAWSRTHNAKAIIVYKEKNLLRLYDGGRTVKSYAADMGRNRLNRKIRAGDQATPEGRYRIVGKKDRGSARYFKALTLDYPNAEDRRRLEQAKRRGEITRRAGPGDHIQIHGEGGLGEDWTLGCVALSNGDMQDLFSRVGVGTPVTIVGGDGQDGTFSNLARASAARQFVRGS